MSTVPIRLLLSVLALTCASCASAGGDERRDAGRLADAAPGLDAAPDDARDADAAPHDASADGAVADAGPDGARDAGSDPDVCGNGLDDDGDGAVDEGCACAPDATQPCFVGEPALAGVGRCVRGVQRCGGAELTSWGACEGSGAPDTERCNGADDDCDGTVDEGCDGCAPTFLGWPISAEDMRTGASDTTGPGECSGTAYFSGTTGSTTPPGGCGVPHCGTLRYGDGRTRAQHCTVRAECVDGVATATGFGW